MGKKNGWKPATCGAEEKAAALAAFSCAPFAKGAVAFPDAKPEIESKVLLTATEMIYILTVTDHTAPPSLKGKMMKTLGQLDNMAAILDGMKKTN